MKLIKKLQFPEAKFDLYFLGYDSPKAISHGNNIWDRQGLIELTHNYGTEDDPGYKVNNGMLCSHFPTLSRDASAIVTWWAL